MNSPIPILLYHRIDGSGDVQATSPSNFAAQLQCLHQGGWTSLAAAEFSAIMRGKARAVRNSFLITFDDGYESILTSAVEVLRKLNFSALCFIATNLIELEEKTPALINTPELSRSLFLSWSQVRELQSSGFIDCQSHSHTHHQFSNFTLAEIEQDLGLSVDILAYQLRLPRGHLSHLAWPWGLSSSAWRKAAVRTGFQHQYTVARQAYRSGTSINKIPRICFDNHSFGKFKRELWLQTGQLSSFWDAIYPYGRKVRHVWKKARYLTTSKLDSAYHAH